MRVMFMAVMLACTGCVDGFLESDCDVYADYLCDCGDPDCETVREQLGDGGSQEQCRVDLACYEDADEAANQVCSLVDENGPEECV